MKNKHFPKKKKFKIWNMSQPIITKFSLSMKRYAFLYELNSKFYLQFFICWEKFVTRNTCQHVCKLEIISQTRETSAKLFQISLRRKDGHQLPLYLGIRIRINWLQCVEDRRMASKVSTSQSPKLLNVKLHDKRKLELQLELRLLIN